MLSTPGPSARIFVARPPRSIAPSPSPAVGKGHPRTGGGGAARGTLVRTVPRPSYAGLLPAGAFAFGPGPRPAARLSSLFCVSLISLSKQPGIFLFFACSPFFSCSSSSFLLLYVSLSFCLSLCFCVSVSLTLTLSPYHPGEPTPTSLPADNSCVHTCPQRGGLARPFSWVHVGLQESPPLSLQWAWLGRGFFPWPHWGGGCSHPSRGDNSCRGRWIDCFSAYRGDGARWRGLGLTLGRVEQRGWEGHGCAPSWAEGWEEGSAGGAEEESRVHSSQA